MLVNLLELVQKSLDYPPLQKIDANTQEVVLDPTKPDTNRFAQAAIPTVLIGLATFSKNVESLNDIFGNQLSKPLITTIFGETKNEIIKKVANYAYYNEAVAETKMNEIAEKATLIMMESLPAEKTNQQINDFFEEQKIEVLKYLPNELQIGQTLNNNAIDDQTHKMEGPISSLMHVLENTFSTTTTKE